MFQRLKCVKSLLVLMRTVEAASWELRTSPPVANISLDCKYLVHLMNSFRRYFKLRISAFPSNYSSKNKHFRLLCHQAGMLRLVKKPRKSVGKWVCEVASSHQVKITNEQLSLNVAKKQISKRNSSVKLFHWNTGKQDACLSLTGKMSQSCKKHVCFSLCIVFGFWKRTC